MWGQDPASGLWCPIKSQATKGLRLLESLQAELRLGPALQLPQALVTWEGWGAE